MTKKMMDKKSSKHVSMLIICLILIFPLSGVIISVADLLDFYRDKGLEIPQSILAFVILVFSFFGVALFAIMLTMFESGGRLYLLYVGTPGLAISNMQYLNYEESEKVQVFIDNILYSKEEKEEP